MARHEEDYATWELGTTKIRGRTQHYGTAAVLLRLIQSTGTFKVLISAFGSLVALINDCNTDEGRTLRTSTLLRHLTKSRELGGLSRIDTDDRPLLELLEQ